MRGGHYLIGLIVYESQAKTVPSVTAVEIQGLTSNPENFLFRGHRKSTDSLLYCISLWYGNFSNQDCKALQRVVRLAERISGNHLILQESKRVILSSIKNMFSMFGLMLKCQM